MSELAILQIVVSSYKGVYRKFANIFTSVLRQVPRNGQCPLPPGCMALKAGDVGWRLGDEFRQRQSVQGIPITYCSWKKCIFVDISTGGYIRLSDIFRENSRKVTLNLFSVNIHIHQKPSSAIFREGIRLGLVYRVRVSCR